MFVCFFQRKTRTPTGDIDRYAMCIESTSTAAWDHMLFSKTQFQESFCCQWWWWWWWWWCWFSNSVWKNQAPPSSCPGATTATHAGRLIILNPSNDLCPIVCPGGCSVDKRGTEELHHCLAPRPRVMLTYTETKPGSTALVGLNAVCIQYF